MPRHARLNLSDSGAENRRRRGRVVAVYHTCIRSFSPPPRGLPAAPPLTGTHRYQRGAEGRGETSLPGGKWQHRLRQHTSIAFERASSVAFERLHQASPLSVCASIAFERASSVAFERLRRLTAFSIKRRLTAFSSKVLKQCSRRLRGNAGMAKRGRNGNAA